MRRASSSKVSRPRWRTSSTHSRRARLNSALNVRRFLLGRTSVGGTTGRCLSVIVMDHGPVALLSKLRRGRCLTHVGREGAPARARSLWSFCPRLLSVLPESLRAIRLAAFLRRDAPRGVLATTVARQDPRRFTLRLGLKGRNRIVESRFTARLTSPGVDGASSAVLVTSNSPTGPPRRRRGTTRAPARRRGVPPWTGSRMS